MLRHACDNPGCVRSSHLRLGTQAENISDRAASGHTATGERHGSAKLTEELVLSIRRAIVLQGKSKRSMARLYGVRLNTIQAIASGRTWKHVPVGVPQ